MRIPALLLWACFVPGLSPGAEAITAPHLERRDGPITVALGGRSFTSQGLVGAGNLPAGTVDFLGDTLGSFSSLQVRDWRRVGDGYEGVLWTLPDRGRNDPAARLFFDYAARLHRFRIRYSPASGVLDMVPDGGLRLQDFRGQPFTGADPGEGTVTQRGLTLPAPAGGAGAGKVSLDAESLQFTRDGSFYIGDEYSANVYYFDSQGRLAGVIQPPAAIVPRRGGRPDFGSLEPPETGRRNNQGVEGLTLTPDGHTLLVALQSALVQDTATGNASGRVNMRVLAYDVGSSPVPAAPVGHYVVQLPAYRDTGDGRPANRTAAQSEIRAVGGRQFLMLSRDGAGLGASGSDPVVYKSILLVDLDGATNLAGTPYERGTRSVLAQPDSPTLHQAIRPAQWVELVNMLNPSQLERRGLGVGMLSEKWEAMDLVPVLDPAAPHDYLLFVGNDNDFVSRHCVMVGQACDSGLDNDSRVLVYRLTLP